MKLKEYRLKHKLSQKEVGKIINKTGTGYGYYETGKNEPDIKTLITLAHYYHTTIDDLVGIERPELVNLNLMNKEERSLFEIMQKLTLENLGKVQAYAEAKLDEQNRR